MSTAAIDEELLLRCLERRLIAAHVADDLRERGGVAAALVHEAGLAVETVVDMLGELGADFGSIDDWRLLLPLGSGSAAQVFLAERDGVRRALKLVHVQDAADAARLEREVAAGLGFDHPHVLKLHGTGTWRGAPYLLLDHCPGGDCERLLRRRGALPANEVLTILRDAATGVEAIHAAGLIHRDLKPANLLGDANGRIVVADLGLARDRDQRLTHTGAVLGTPAYLAPEQARGDSDLDQRCDVWALGACAFALACGRPPYTGATPWETVARVVREEPPDPRTLRADIPGPLRTIIRTCLVRDSTHRYASAAEIAADCTAALAGEPLRHAGTYRPSHADTPTPLTSSSRSAPTWLPLAAAVALPGVLGVLLGWMVAHPGADDGGAAALAELQRAHLTVTASVAVIHDPERERRALMRDIAAEERLIASLQEALAAQRESQHPKPPAPLRDTPTPPTPAPPVATPAVVERPAPVSEAPEIAATPTTAPKAASLPVPAPMPALNIPLQLSRCDVIHQEDDLLIGLSSSRIVVQRDGEPERELALPWAPQEKNRPSGYVRDLERCHDDRTWYVPLRPSRSNVVGFLSRDQGVSWAALTIPADKEEFASSFFDIWSTMDGDGRLIVAQSSTHRYVTQDGGKQWRRSPLSNRMTPLIVRPPRSAPFLIDRSSGSSDRTIATSSDLGESWLVHVLPPDVRIPSSYFNSRGIERTWFVLGDELVAYHLELQSILVFDPQRRLRTAWSPLVGGRGAAQQRSTIRRMIVQPHDPQVWYAQLEGGDLIRSLDGGQTWWSRGRKPPAYSSTSLLGIFASEDRVILASKNSSRLDLFDITTPQLDAFPFRAGADLDPNLPLNNPPPTLATGLMGPGGAEILLTGADHISGLDVALDHAGVCFASGSGRIWRLKASPLALDLIHAWEVDDLTSAQPAARIQTKADAARWFVPATTSDNDVGWVFHRGLTRPTVVPPPAPGRGRAWMDAGSILRYRHTGNTSDLCHVSSDLGKTWMRNDVFRFGSGTPVIFEGISLSLSEQGIVNRISIPGWNHQPGVYSDAFAADDCFAATIDVPGTGMLALTDDGVIIALSAAGQYRVEAVSSVLNSALSKMPTALMAVHPKTPAVRYLAIPSTGILRTRDQGRSWYTLDARHRARTDTPMILLQRDKRVLLVFIDQLGNLVALDETDARETSFPLFLRP